MLHTKAQARLLRLRDALFTNLNLIALTFVIISQFDLGDIRNNDGFSIEADKQTALTESSKIANELSKLILQLSL